MEVRPMAAALQRRPRGLAVLGRVIENFMELQHAEAAGKERIRETLARYGLSYQQGGVILRGGSGQASKSLRQLLQAKDVPAVEQEFERAVAAVEADPAAGVTAACSLLESLFKVYIEDNGLSVPAKQTIGDLYRVVRDHLGLDPVQVAEQDLKRILSGLISIVDGIGALRTHGGSAHGRSRRGYRVEPRHARLAINGAHTLAVFVLETWAHREQGAG